MDEAEEIRQRKLRELQERINEQQRQRELRRQHEIQKQQAIQQILTPGARSRLSNLRVAKPEFVEQLELELIQLVRAGRVNPPITDEQLRDVLGRLQERKRDFRIMRK